MDWAPISEVDLWDLVIKAEARVFPQLSRLWQAIKITPQKWNEQSYGQAGGGFWVVALIGENAIWYNDIEDGFNRSSSRHVGELDEYSATKMSWRPLFKVYWRSSKPESAPLRAVVRPLLGCITHRGRNGQKPSSN